MSQPYQKVKFTEPFIIKSYTCPIANLTYYGDCSVLSCPYNISRSKPGVGGCFQLVGKPSLIDVAVWSGITTGEAKHQYKKSLRVVDRFLNFYAWLQNFRFYKNTYFKLKSKCSQCGIPNNSDCINTSRCQSRQRFIAKTMAKQPFSLPDLKFKKEEFWEVVEAQRRGKIVEVVPERFFNRAVAALNRLKIAIED